MIRDKDIGVYLILYINLITSIGSGCVAIHEFKVWCLTTII